MNHIVVHIQIKEIVKDDNDRERMAEFVYETWEKDQHKKVKSINVNIFRSRPFLYSAL